MVAEIDRADEEEQKQPESRRPGPVGRSARPFAWLFKKKTASSPAPQHPANENEATALPSSENIAPLSEPSDDDEVSRVSRFSVRGAVFQWIRVTGFSSLLRQIIVINLIALIVLMAGIQFSNKFRKGLIVARAESLLTQGRILAGAVSASATVERDAITIDPDKLLSLEVGGPDGTVLPEVESLDFPIDPQKVAPVLRRLIQPGKLRARIYDNTGELILDSRFLYRGGEILRFNLPAIDAGEKPFWEQTWNWLNSWFKQSNFPLYKEHSGADGKAYPEVAKALKGGDATAVRVREKGEIVVSVAVPIQRFRAVLGALLLSTEGSDIDRAVASERKANYRVFLVAFAVTIVLSTVLWYMIASPLRRLSDAADNVRTAGSRKTRKQIPHFGQRSDEIGILSKSVRGMTEALYARIDAIGNFAADVSHELKNPLTSLRSAVETLPLARTEENRKKLLDIIQHDVQRLDRLITDISDASRLDAELAREKPGPVCIKTLLTSLISLSREVHGEDIRLDLTFPGRNNEDLCVEGHDGRLGQVINNLLDNARTFAPNPGGRIWVSAEKRDRHIVVTVADNGPGIDPDALERIFRRFYTDRPDGDDFGRNSGLGLSITRQIVEAHKGTIIAENRERTQPDGSKKRIGARFIIRLPATS